LPLRVQILERKGRQTYLALRESAKYPLGVDSLDLSSEKVTMTGFNWVRSAFAAAALIAIAAPASADDTGVAAIHDQRREGGRLCFVDHYHYGSSAGKSSKAAALSAAVVSWSDFTDFEYGSDWAHWGLSSSKSVKCSREGIRGPWGCDVSARPCRR